MAGELLPPTAQGHITEGVVEPQAVQALQDSVGVPGLHEQVVLAAQWGCRSGGGGGGGGGGAGVLLDREGDVHRGQQPGVDFDDFSHVSLLHANPGRQNKTVRALQDDEYSLRVTAMT